MFDGSQVIRSAEKLAMARTHQSARFHLENGSYQRDQGHVNVNVHVKQLLISITAGSLFTGT